VLALSLFLEWYSLSLSGTGWTYYGPPIGGTAWEAFALLDVALLLLALAPLARLVVPAIPGVLAAAAGALAAVLIGIRITVPPDPADQLVVKAPAWIALAGAILVLAGSLRALVANRRRA
jgi:hypothetical protein